MNPLVSILIPVYNSEKFLSETLESIAKLRYLNLEVIVVNDGSTDESLNIASEKLSNGFPHKFKIINQENKGEVFAVNNAVLESKGEFLLVVNSDDTVEPELLEASIKVMLADKDCVVTYVDWFMIDSNSKVIRKEITFNYSLSILLGDLHCIPGPGALVRRSALDPKQKLRDPKFKLVSDLKCWLDLSKQGHFVRIPRFLASWRNHEGTTSARVQGTAELAMQFIKIPTAHFSKPVPIEHQRLRSQCKSMSLYRAAIQTMDRPDHLAQKLLLRSLLTPFRRSKSESHIQLRRDLKMLVAILIGAKIRGHIVNYRHKLHLTKD